MFNGNFLSISDTCRVNFSFRCKFGSHLVSLKFHVHNLSHIRCTRFVHTVILVWITSAFVMNCTSTGNVHVQVEYGHFVIVFLHGMVLCSDHLLMQKMTHEIFQELK